MSHQFSLCNSRELEPTIQNFSIYKRHVGDHSYQLIAATATSHKPEGYQSLLSRAQYQQSRSGQLQIFPLGKSKPLNTTPQIFDSQFETIETLLEQPLHVELTPSVQQLMHDPKLPEA